MLRDAFWFQFWLPFSYLLHPFSILFADFTCEDFADFKMDVSDLVDMLDMVESDDLVVAIVIEFDLGVDTVPQKPEIGARL